MNILKVESIIVLLISRCLLDEHIDAYVVLRTVPRAEAQLRDLFVRLHVDVEIQAYGFQSRPSSRQNTSNESSPSRSEDSLWSGTIDTSELPVIITQGEEKKHGDLLAVWKTTIPLSESLAAMYISRRGN